MRLQRSVSVKRPLPLSRLFGSATHDRAIACMVIAKAVASARTRRKCVMGCWDVGMLGFLDEKIHVERLQILRSTDLQIGRGFHPALKASSRSTFKIQQSGSVHIGEFQWEPVPRHVRGVVVSTSVKSGLAPTPGDDAETRRIRARREIFRGRAGDYRARASGEGHAAGASGSGGGLRRGSARNLWDLAFRRTPPRPRPARRKAHPGTHVPRSARGRGQGCPRRATERERTHARRHAEGPERRPGQPRGRPACCPPRRPGREAAQ